MKPTLLHALVPLTYFANDSCWWFVMFANFFITFEKAKKKLEARHHEQLCKKLTKSTLKKDVEKSLLVLY